jgi:hypothetical protein
MRKLMILPSAGLLAFSVVGPVAAAPNTSNSSGSGTAIYGEWSSDGTSGYVSFGVDSTYGSFGDIYQETGQWVECDPGAGAVGGKEAAVPYDTTGGDYGFVGTRTWGYSDDVQLDLSRRLETGHATGTADMYTATVDECAGDYGDNAVATVVAIDVSLTASGPLSTFRNSGQYKIPSQFNGHDNYRGKERAATGSIVAGSLIDATFSSADMLEVTWSSHSNS